MKMKLMRVEKPSSVKQVILDDKAGICGHQDKALDGRVQANPEAELHVVRPLPLEGRSEDLPAGLWAVLSLPDPPWGLICSLLWHRYPLGTARGLELSGKGISGLREFWGKDLLGWQKVLTHFHSETFGNKQPSE